MKLENINAELVINQLTEEEGPFNTSVIQSVNNIVTVNNQSANRLRGHRYMCRRTDRCKDHHPVHKVNQRYH